MNTVKAGLDGGAAMLVLGSLAGYLPSVAALLGIIWYCIQIYEWLRNRKKK